MARDKLITVRVEEELRHAFNQWAKANNTDASTVLYEFVRQCIDGQIDVSGFGNQKVNLDSKRLDDLARQIQELDNQLDKRIEEKIYYAITSLSKEEMVKKENQPKKQSVFKPVTNKNVNPEVQVTQKDNLTNAELARLLKITPPTVSRWANGKRTPPADLDWSFNPKTKRWNSRG